MEPARNEELETRLAAVEATLEALRRRVAKALAGNGAEHATRAPTSTPSSAAASFDLAPSHVGLDALACRDRATADNHDMILAAQSAQLQEVVELLRRREEDLRALKTDIEGLRQQQEDLASHMPILRQAFRAIDLRLRRIEGPKPVRPPGAVQVGQKERAPSGSSSTRPTTRAAATDVRGAGGPPPISDVSFSVQPPDPGNAVAVECARLIHIEENAEIQHAIEELAKKWAVDYHRFGQPLAQSAGEHRLLVVNLALSRVDSLSEIAKSADWGIAEPAAFTYCADGSNGAVLGIVHFFPPPFDVAACVRRLLSRPSRPQRLLVVGEAFETMNALKDSLAQVQCGISMAFDTRQAVDLVPMLKPDLLLIDMNMPRGEALRLAMRLHAAHAGAQPPLGFFWTDAIPPGEFREHALRAIRDLVLSPDDLARALSRSLAPDGRDW
jgi:CheY-like chemotaxis protein